MLLGVPLYGLSAFKQRGCCIYLLGLSHSSRDLKVSSDPAVTVRLARPFHSIMVLLKKENLYWAVPLFGGIVKGLELFVV